MRRFQRIASRLYTSVHSSAHPGARLSNYGDGVVEAASLNTDEPIIERPSVVKANVAPEELMARLAEEDDEICYDGTQDIGLRNSGA